MKLICWNSRQLGQRFSQASPEAIPELLTGNGVAYHALISLNTRTPAYQNMIIHLRASTKNVSQLCLTDLLCLNSKARYSFKRMHLVGADAVSGAELVPELAMIVHGRIVKGNREVVKENSWWLLRFQRCF